MTTSAFHTNSLFKTFTTKQLHTITENTEQVTLTRRNEHLKIPTQNPKLHVIQSGRVLLQYAALTQTPCTIEILEKGDIAGELALFNQPQKTLYIKPLTTAELLLIPVDVVKEIAQKNSEFSEKITQLLAERLLKAQQRIGTLTLLKSTEKVALLLLQLSQGKDEFVIPLTQEELASMLGLTREKVNRSIKKLITQGFLVKKNFKYIIVERKELEKLTLWQT